MTDHPVALVRVPVELAGTPAIRNALGLYRSAILCGEQWSDTCRDAYLAALKELDQFAMLAAAPAPSSLAGGEKCGDETAEQIVRRWASWINDVSADMEEPEWGGKTHNDVLNERDFLVRILAALSPEAPAREGEWFTTDTVEVEYHDGNGETHMSPWEVDWGNVARWRPQPDADPIPKDTASSTEEDDDDASTYAPSIAGLSDYLWNQALEAESVESRCILEIWREAVDALTPRHEAPAEGAGEREEIARIMDPKGWETRDRQYEAIKRSTMHDKDRPLAFANADYYTRDSLTKADAIIDLRARSSAPEAREGDAVAWQMRIMKTDGTPFSGWKYHGANAPSGYDVKSVQFRPLYAAPSADKLRIAVEALLHARSDLLGFACSRGSEYEGSAESVTEEIDQALVALKAEGGK